jgi:hypothetical protein
LSTADDAPLVGCSAVLYGRANERSPHTRARECHHGSNHPQKRRDGH